MKRTLTNKESDTLMQFYEVARRVGLIDKYNNYIDGTPKGSEEDVNLFYTLEDKLGYPKPHRISDYPKIQHILKSNT